MAYQDINTGTPGNRDGDKLRNAFVKVKDMFIELYSLIKTNTSQLVNDGANGTDPFITAKQSLNDVSVSSEQYMEFFNGANGLIDRVTWIDIKDRLGGGIKTITLNNVASTTQVLGNSLNQYGIYENIYYLRQPLPNGSIPALNLILNFIPTHLNFFAVSTNAVFTITGTNFTLQEGFLPQAREANSVIFIRRLTSTTWFVYGDLKKDPNAQTPPIANTYTTQALMFADQSIQKTGFIYRVGNDTFEKLATSAGVISDYKQVNVGGELEKITEGGKTGYRIRGANPDNYGDIGHNAVDLSFSNNISSDYGATGDLSHAEGDSTIASGQASHSEGFLTTASGDYSHAEGSETIASGEASHAEGISTIASSDYSHAEGFITIASGLSSHAEGFSTTASGNYSHAQGRSNYARAAAEFSAGSFGTDYVPLNTANNNPVDRLVNIGNGINETSRSDAFTIYKNGSMKLHPVTQVSITNATAGSIIIDLSDSNKLKFHDGTAWRTVSFT